MTRYRTFSDQELVSLLDRHDAARLGGGSTDIAEIAAVKAEIRRRSVVSCCTATGMTEREYFRDKYLRQRVGLPPWSARLVIRFVSSVGRLFGG